jgi:hypothetical protein
MVKLYGPGFVVVYATVATCCDPDTVPNVSPVVLEDKLVIVRPPVWNANVIVIDAGTGLLGCQFTPPEYVVDGADDKANSAPPPVATFTSTVKGPLSPCGSGSGPGSGSPACGASNTGYGRAIFEIGCARSVISFSLACWIQHPLTGATRLYAYRSTVTMTADYTGGGKAD